MDCGSCKTLTQGETVSISNPGSNIRDMAAPAVASQVITPHDVDDLGVATRRLYVGHTGDITLLLVGDSDGVGRLMKAAPIGEYNWAVRRVFNTGTTAQNLIGLS